MANFFIEGTVLAPYQTNKTAAYYENLYLNGNDTSGLRHHARCHRIL